MFLGAALPAPPLVSQVHSLIGDYHTGLQCLFPLNIFDKTHLYTPLISSCHITLFYYSSFAYVMLQRYTDAGRWVYRMLRGPFLGLSWVGALVGREGAIVFWSGCRSVVLVMLAEQ